MVVLAAAIEPDKSGRRPLATMLTASMDTNDFFTEAHPEAASRGKPHRRRLPLRLSARGRRTFPKTVAQACAAAAKVIGLLSKDKLTWQPLHCSFRRADVQRLLHLRKRLPVRSDHLYRQGIQYARPNDRECDGSRRSTKRSARAAVPAPLPARPALWTLRALPINKSWRR